MSNYVKSLISPMYLHKAQNRRACHIYDAKIVHVSLDSVTNVTKFYDQPLTLENVVFIFLTMLTKNAFLKPSSP